MNEFSKDELEEIFCILEGSTMDYIGKEDNVLLEKIQSMIDNYCEHVDKYEFMCGETKISYCDKCKTTFKEA